jgi:hypothetical protein
MNHDFQIQPRLSPTSGLRPAGVTQKLNIFPQSSNGFRQDL